MLGKEDTIEPSSRQGANYLLSAPLPIAQQQPLESVAGLQNRTNIVVSKS